MGRHRSDPMGLARISIAVLAVVLALGLVVLGGVALWDALTKDSSGHAATPSPSASTQTAKGGGKHSDSPVTMQSGGNTVVIQCLAVACPVYVAGPGPNDVQYQGKLKQNERRIFNETRLTVAIDDASTVNVTINGRAQAKGRPGQQKTYVVPSRH